MKHKQISMVLGTCAILFLGFVLLFRYIIPFDFMTGDAASYWNLSFNQKYFFHAWWVPGYSIIISLARSISLNLFPPTVLMQIISGTGYLLGCVGVYSVLKNESEQDETLGLIFTGLYALFPFAGVAYAVLPIADALALAALVGCFYFLGKKNWLAMAILIATASLLQKTTWFFLPLLVLFAFVKYKQSRPYMVAAAIPLLLYLAAGAMVKQDIFWAFRWSAEKLLTTKSSLPILDGVIGPLLSEESLTKLLRAVIVLAVFVVTAATLATAYRQRQYEAMIIPIGLMLMAFFVNQYEIWSFVRYAKLLSLPAGMILLRMPNLFHKISKPVIAMPFFIVCLLTNLAYMYYVVRIFY